MPTRLLTWGLAVLLGLLWTLGAWMGAAVTGWASEVLQAGEFAVDESRRVAWSELPAWLQRWADLLGLTAWREASLEWLTVAQRHLPMLGALLAWLVPVIWIVWGAGIVLLLVGTAGLLRLLARHRPA